MSNTTLRPVSFYHQDGLVPAWNYAARYAGQGGHIATLPEIVELRLGKGRESKDSPWQNWYTSASAEYVGLGADGRMKIIVAHGVGPMSTIDGIKAAYKWEYADKSRNHRGGRITARQFLDLEAGNYGEVNVVDPKWSYMRDAENFKVGPVNVLDFRDYLTHCGNDAFSRYLTSTGALYDPLLRIRLGSKGYDYIQKHGNIAMAFHRTERPNADSERHSRRDDVTYPYITKVDDAPNCGYLVPNKTLSEGKRHWVWEPRIPEKGYALAHLLDIDQFMRTHTFEIGVMLMSATGAHEWGNGAKFIAVPEGATLVDGLSKGPDADKVLREHWEHFMEPVPDDYVPILPFHLKRAGDEWFTQYPKKFPSEQCMDDGNIEFHVDSVEPIGGTGTFTTDEMFFLRYKLSQVRDIMPREANAYEILDISKQDARGITTVTVRFYRASVDLTRRLPRADTIARDYERLMEVYAH